jgi:hypothetical protein
VQIDSLGRCIPGQPAVVLLPPNLHTKCSLVAHVTDGAFLVPTAARCYGCDTQFKLGYTVCLPVDYAAVRLLATVRAHIVRMPVSQDTL